MTHVRLERQLSAYLDNELTAEEGQEVRAHLEVCAACREELVRLQQVKRLLARLPEVAPPETLWTSLRTRVQEALRPQRRDLVKIVRAAFRRPVVAVAAAALAIALVAFPLVKGHIDRLRASEVGVDLYVREHALTSVADPFADRAYLGLLIGDTNIALIGEPRPQEER